MDPNSDVDAMCGGIDDQRMPAEMSWSVFEHAILVGGILLDYGHGAGGIRGVHAVQYRIVTRAVHQRADRKDRDDFSCIGIEHDQMLAAAGGKKAVVRGIEASPVGPSQGPSL